MSFSKFIYHIVFATKNRCNTILPEHEREVYAIINHVVKKHGGHLHRVNGMPDHIHILVDIPPTIAVSAFIQSLKRESSVMIKETRKFPNWDGWQNGYGAFSYATADIPKIRQYIISQKEHHRKVSFIEEYRNWLIEMGISPDAPFFPK